MSLMDFPSIYFAYYLDRMQNERMTLAERLEMLQNALNKAEINREEFLRLFDLPTPDLLVNAPGGTC